MMLLSRRVGKLWMATGKLNATFEEMSNTIVDPYFYDNKDLLSKVQNWSTNRGVLSDMQRSFKDFNKSAVSSRFLSTYNLVVSAVNH